MQKRTGGSSPQRIPITGPPAATAAVSRKVQLLLVVMGMLDLSSYAIFNLGFAVCGSALASVVLAAAGQISVALVSTLFLHRRLSSRHMAAVTTVTIGLVLRSADDVDVSRLGTLTATSAGSGAGPLYGVLCVVVSALLFSVLGCLYEVLMNADPGSHVSQAQVRHRERWYSSSIHSSN